jgi:hypothetical protein
MRKHLSILVIVSWLFPLLGLAGGNCISSLGLGIIPNGGSVTGYLSPTSLPALPCASTIVTCINGVLSGPDLYPACTSINQDCAGVPDGGVLTGYISPVPPCVMTTVTCINGVLSGPLPAVSCVDTPVLSSIPNF